MKRLAAVSLFASSTALAEPPPPLDATAAAPELVTQSILPNLFATSLGTTIEARLDYSDIDQIDLTVLNALAHVQYLTPQGFGGYVRVPFGYIEDDGSAGVFEGAKGIGKPRVRLAASCAGWSAAAMPPVPKVKVAPPSIANGGRGWWQGGLAGRRTCSAP